MKIGGPTSSQSFAFFKWNPDAIPRLLRGSMATAVAVREFEYLTTFLQILFLMETIVSNLKFDVITYDLQPKCTQSGHNKSSWTVILEPQRGAPTFHPQTKLLAPSAMQVVTLCHIVSL